MRPFMRQTDTGTRDFMQLISVWVGMHPHGCKDLGRWLSFNLIL